MKTLISLVAAAVAAFVLAAPVHAHQPKPAKPYSKMTLDEKERAQERALAHHQGAWRWWHKRLRAPQAFSATSVVTRQRCRGVLLTPTACWHLEAAVWTKRELAKTRAAIERLWNPRDYASAVRLVERFYGPQPFLWSCPKSEGGFGPWVPNRHGSGAGGWLQFMEGTFWSVMRPAGPHPGAIERARAKGMKVPEAARSWYSPLGQALAGVEMLIRGRRGEWEGGTC